MSFSLPSSLDTIDLFGFYLPAPLIWAAFAVLPCVLLCWGLRRLGFYRLNRYHVSFSRQLANSFRGDSFAVCIIGRSIS